MSKPTFDEWYRKSHGSSFDEHYWYDDEFPIGVIKILSLRMREYVSEMVQPEAEPKPGTVTMTTLDELKARMNERMCGVTSYMRGTTPPLTWKTERPVYEDLVAAANRMYGWTEPDLVSAYTVCSVRERPVHHQHYEPIGDEV